MVVIKNTVNRMMKSPASRSQRGILTMPMFGFCSRYAASSLPQYPWLLSADIGFSCRVENQLYISHKRKTFTIKRTDIRKGERI
jgi:hypothetical protein